MLTDWLLPILLFGALALMLIGATRRVLAWRAGRNEPVAVVAGLMAMPRRYLVDLHHVVQRDRFIANTHVATAGGFVAALALALLVHGFGVDSSILNGLILLSAAACLLAPAASPGVGGIRPAVCRAGPGCGFRKACWCFPPRCF